MPGKTNLIYCYKCSEGWQVRINHGIPFDFDTEHEALKYADELALWLHGNVVRSEPPPRRVLG